MLTDVIYDMKVFLFILLIVYFAFGEAFLRLTEYDKNYEFLPNYATSLLLSYEISLGLADPEGFENLS